MPPFRSLASAALGAGIGLFSACPEANALEFEAPEGIAATSAVEPGLVAHPVMAAFDDRGRLFVAETSGENLNKEELLEKKPALIRLLEDTDGNGVFDKQTVFADGLTFPQGALWIYDSLYVMSPPGLWRFADEDGDGVAEVREELVTGFDFTGNAADVHGPFLHPNGRLFWCHGRKGFAVPDNDTGEILYTGKGARIWSAQLSGGEVEPFAGGGMDNPVEIDFTDEGEIVGTVNLFFGRPRGDTLTHWVHGGAYPRRDQGEVLAEFTRTGDLLPPVHDFGHVAVSGMCRYRSGSLDPAWADQWLVTHFNTSMITRSRFEPSGATFAEAETEILFRLLEPDSHLTDVLEDRNGDILAIDTGGWFRIGCPTSQISKPDVPGGIYRIHREGQPYLAPVYPEWDRLTSEQVAAYLGAEEVWLAERAITELAVRGDPAIPELRNILESGDFSPGAKRNAVWTMARMKFSEAADLVFAALTDPDPGVRQAACNALGVTRTWQYVAANQPAEREIELERNRTISGALAAIVRGDEAPVARAAAVALGRMAEYRAIGAIVGRLGRAAEDRFLEHSLIYALIEIDDFDSVHPLLTSENPQIVRGVFWALEEMPSSRLQVLDVLPFLESDDDSLRETVYTITRRHHEWDAALANRFFRWEGPIEGRKREALEAIVPPFLDSPPMTDFLTSLLSSQEAARQSLGLSLLARSTTDLPFQSNWMPAFEPRLAATAPVAELTLALDAALRVNTEELDALLRSVVSTESLPRLLRVKAARALASANEPLSDESFGLLMEILDQETDAASRGEAIAILAASRLNPQRRDRLARAIGSFGPLEINSLFELFPKLDNPAQAELVAEAVVASPGFANLPVERVRRLFEPFADIVGPKVEARIAEAEKQHAEREQRIESFLRIMPDADPAAGKAVFSNGKGTCNVCHAIGETGGRIGPDLTTIGRIRSARDLFESILYPNESIARDFNTSELSLAGGEKRVGIVAGRTEHEVELIDPAGQSHRFPVEDVTSIRHLPMSLMPIGLDMTMTAEELRNLVAYLLEQK